MLAKMSPAIFSAWTYVLEATNDLFSGAESLSGTSPKGATSDMLSLTHTKYLRITQSNVLKTKLINLN